MPDSSGGHADTCPPHLDTVADTLIERIQGVDVPDPFRWLEDSDSPRVKRWVDLRDSQARGLFAADPLRASVFEELRTSTEPYHYKGMPENHRGRYFYRRIDPGSERGAVFEYDPAHSRERVLLSLDNLDTVPRAWFVTSDGSKLAVVVGASASDDMTVRVYDTRAHKWLADEVSGLRFSYPSWSSDGSGFYYTWSPPQRSDLTASQREAQSDIRFHTLGRSASRDEVIRPATGMDATVELPTASADGRWIQIGRWNAKGTTIFIGRTRAPHPAPTQWIQVTPRDARTTYSLTFGREALFVRTDEGAPHGRLFRVDPAHPDRSDWKEIVAERTDASLEHVAVTGEYVSVLIRS